MKHRGVENAGDNALQNRSKISSRRFQNRGPGSENGLLEVFRGSEAEAVLEAILEAMLTPPGLQNQETSLKMGSKIEAFFESRFEAFLKAPGRLVASILGAFWA